MAETLIGEQLIFLSIVSFIFLMGALAAVQKIHSNRSTSKWAFQPSVNTTAQTDNGTPIDYLNNQTISVIHSHDTSNDVVSINSVIEPREYDVSHIEDNEELMMNIDEIVSSLQVDSTSLRVTRAKEQAAFLVGDVVADFITASLEDLPKEQAIIFGRFVLSDNYIEMNGSHLKLSAVEQLNLADGDLMLIKGQLLPNGEFRVLHWDDADNVEAGYGHDDFVIQKVS